MNTSPSGPNNEMPRHRHHQLDALARMFGEALPPSAPVPPAAAVSDTFTPLAGTHDEAREPGRIFWNGVKWPAWAPPLTLGARRLHVLIDHQTLRGSHRPKLPDRIAHLRADITRLSHTTGVHTLPISTPPEHWTAASVADLARRIVPLIPNDIPGTDDLDTSIDLRHHPYQSPEITFERDGRQYTATVRLDHRAIGFLAAFTHARACAGFFHDQVFHGSLRDLLTPAETTEDVTQPDLDDSDDLATLERTARQTLHGRHAETGHVLADLMHACTGLPPRRIRILIRMAEILR